MYFLGSSCKIVEEGASKDVYMYVVSIDSSCSFPGAQLIAVFYIPGQSRSSSQVEQSRRYVCTTIAPDPIPHIQIPIPYPISQSQSHTPYPNPIPNHHLSPYPPPPAGTINRTVHLLYMSCSVAACHSIPTSCPCRYPTKRGAEVSPLPAN